MRRLPILLIVCLVLAACRLPLGGWGAERAAPAAGPIASGAIEVTPLATAPGAAAKDSAAKPLPAKGAEAGPAGARPARAPASAATKPGAVGAPPPIPAPVPAPAVAVKSPGQITCEKGGGTYARVSTLFTCVKTPRDAGKHCTRESDCTGRCLARSNTCAPFDPLVGCNDILDDMGRDVKLCLD